MHRRQALRTAARAALGLGALALAGCGQRRVGGVVSRVGEPIPGDPVVRRTSLPPAAGGAAPVVRASFDPSLPPGVIPRSQWARFGPNPALADPMLPPRCITVHHDGMSTFTQGPVSASAARLEQIRSYHVGNRGWADIGYHFAIDPAGRVFQGRPLTLQGAHVADRNPGNIGVVCLGNYDEQPLTSTHAAALDAFLAALMARYRIPISEVRTHQEWAPTACPGRSVQAYMNATRSRSGRLASA